MQLHHLALSAVAAASSPAAEAVSIRPAAASDAEACGRVMHVPAEPHAGPRDRPWFV